MNCFFFKEKNHVLHWYMSPVTVANNPHIKRRVSRLVFTKAKMRDLVVLKTLVGILSFPFKDLHWTSCRPNVIQFTYIHLCNSSFSSSDSASIVQLSTVDIAGSLLVTKKQADSSIHIGWVPKQGWGVGSKHVPSSEEPLTMGMHKGNWAQNTAPQSQQGGQGNLGNKRKSTSTGRSLSARKSASPSTGSRNRAIWQLVSESTQSPVLSKLWDVQRNITRIANYVSELLLGWRENIHGI